jgi:hypothetical protein
MLCCIRPAYCYTGPLTEQDETVDDDNNVLMTYHDKVYGYIPSPGITLEELQTMVYHIVYTTHFITAIYSTQLF